MLATQSTQLRTVFPEDGHHIYNVFDGMTRIRSFSQVLPALMNEYRTPEMNVQNGVLKSLSFLFEYIQEMGKVRCMYTPISAFGAP